MKLGLVQMPVTQDKTENLRCACRHVEQLSEQGAELIMLPEMFLCPYSNDCFPIYAEPRCGGAWRALSQMAKSNHVYLVAGSIPEQDGSALYNTSFVFGPDGSQIGRHRKLHLFDIDVAGGQKFCESQTFTAGETITVFDTVYGKLGLCICFDMRFPELSRIMALSGAQMILAPAAFNMTTGPAHWELMLRQRAVDNQLFTAACAPARDEHGVYVSYGNSMVCSPWGTVLCRADAKAIDLICDVDFSENERIRTQLPLLRARRTDLYQLTAR